MYTANSKNEKRPFIVFLYDRTETGEKSHELIAAEVTANHFPYVQIGGIFVDNMEADTPEKRTAFIEMMNACDNVQVDCIAVPTEECLLGNMDLMCDTLKSIAERGISVLDLDTGRFIEYEHIWDELVKTAEYILSYENG